MWMQVQSKYCEYHFISPVVMFGPANQMPFTGCIEFVHFCLCVSAGRAVLLSDLGGHSISLPSMQQVRFHVQLVCCSMRQQVISG
mmetsp:Transcript_8299/g.51693  ORF Transcript_8299/g.51693 Transcript_8299/m.51693 type:complete len:85 (+) Transcript_8299:5813-6067(+)